MARHRPQSPHSRAGLPSRREVLAATAGMALAPALATGGPQDPSPLAPVYPDDAFSRPQHDPRHAFRTLDGVGAHMDVVNRAEAFDFNDLRLEGRFPTTTTLWRFQTRSGNLNALTINDFIRRVPEAVTLRVTNRSTHPVRMGMQLHEMVWRNVPENTASVWNLGGAQPVAPGEVATLRFSVGDATKQSGLEPRTAIRCPVSALVLLATDLVTGSPYDLGLADLTIHYPAPPVEVSTLEAPVALAAGGEAEFRITTAAGRACAASSDATIEVRRGDHVVWRVRLSADETARLASGPLSIKRSIPWYLPQGEVVLGLVVDGLRAAGPEARSVITNDRHPALPHTERKHHNGRPAFWVEGKPYPWNGYSSYDYQPGNVAEFGAHGANVLCVPTCAGRHVHHVSAETWVAPDRFDFGQLDERVCFSLQANPQALLFLRVSLTLPTWWLQQHPEEMARIQSPHGPIVWEEGNCNRVASLASPTWYRDQAYALRRLIGYCKQQPWAGRLAGFWLTCEVTEEWFHWAANDKQYADYSLPMQTAFASAQAARHRPTTIPLPTDRQRPGHDVYPDDAAGRQSAAYHGFLNDLTAQCIRRYAKVVKEETGGRSLAGTFYGYVIQLAGDTRQATAGHMGLRQVLDDPNVDFTGGVPLLNFRDLTNGYNPYCSATESIRAAGKLYCSENDLFSWLHPILWHQPYDPGDPRGAAIQMHRRECANDAVHGTMAQKFSLMASWHHDDVLQQDFALQSRVLADALQRDRTPIEEIAFVVDDTSFAWTPPETPLPAQANAFLQRDLGRTGAPLGVWLLSDLDKLPDRIKLVVVAHAPAAAEADIAKLRKLIARGGRTVLVCGTPGLVDTVNQKWLRDRPSEILGIRVPIAGYTLPSEGAVERSIPAGGRLIWRARPPAGSGQLREVVTRSGVHLYAPEGCFIHASRGLAAITCPYGRTVEIRWPNSVIAVDLFDKWTGSGTTMDMPFRAGHTRLLGIERS